MTYLLSKIISLLEIAKEMGPKNTTLFLIAYPIRNILHICIHDYLFKSTITYCIFRMAMFFHFQMISDPYVYKAFIYITGHESLDSIVDLIAVTLHYFLGLFLHMCFLV